MHMRNRVMRRSKNMRFCWTACLAIGMIAMLRPAPASAETFCLVLTGNPADQVALRVRISELISEFDRLFDSELRRQGASPCNRESNLTLHYNILELKKYGGRTQILFRIMIGNDSTSPMIIRNIADTRYNPSLDEFLPDLFVFETAYLPILNRDQRTRRDVCAELKELRSQAPALINGGHVEQRRRRFGCHV